MKKTLPVGCFEIDLKTFRRDHIIAHRRKNRILHSRRLLASEGRSAGILRMRRPFQRHTQQKPEHATKNPPAYLL